jgi:alpha-beta hydrolase superfamily lysophospholipase
MTTGQRKPIYFGPTERPIFGWLYQPSDGRAGLGLVMCQPLGMEEFGAQPALLHLGETCADSGIVALKFDYDGTGNSFGSWGDPDRMKSWVDSVTHAVEFLRDSGVGKVVVVGVHLGGLFAAKAALDAKVDGIIFWAPTLSGRLYLRQQQMLLATITGREVSEDLEDKGDQFEGPLFSFSGEVANDIRATSVVGSDVPNAIRTLVVTESGELPSGLRRVGWMADTLRAQSPPSGIGEYPNPYHEPVEDVDAIIEWLKQSEPAERAALEVEAAESLAYVTTSGRAVSERPVWIGDVPLFGILTEPEGSADQAPFIFLSTGIWTNVGTGHLWSRLSRSWADLGIRSLRVDLSGIGESGVRPGQAERRMFPQEVVEDFRDIARYFGTDDGRNLVFVGTSTGGFHCLEAGLVLRPRALVMANPTPGEMLDLLSEEIGMPPASSKAYRPFPGPIKRLSVRHRRIALLVWKTLAQVVVSWAPGDALSRVVKRGIRVYVLLGDEDRRHLSDNAYWNLMFTRYQRQGRLVMSFVPGMDHGFFTSWQRDVFVSTLTDWAALAGSEPLLDSAGPDVRRREG